jgi:hypothetical protein
MFSKQVITALLALGSATAAVLPRQSNAGSFYFSSFSIAAQSNSPNAVYSFAVADNSATASNFTTTCFATTPTSPGLGNVPTTLCADNSVSFEFGNNGTGYILTIEHQWVESVQHAIVLAADDISDTGAAFFPNSYLIDGATSGPFEAKIDSTPSFSIPFTRYIV